MGKLINRIPGSRLLISSLLDTKIHSPSILYILASLAMSLTVLVALAGKLDIKRHSPSILYILASLVMSTSILKALPGKLDIKRHSPNVSTNLYCNHKRQHNIIRRQNVLIYIIKGTLTPAVGKCLHFSTK